MNKEMISLSIQEIEDRYIQEAAEYAVKTRTRKSLAEEKEAIAMKKNGSWKRWITVTACVAIVASILFATRIIKPKQAVAMDEKTGYILPKDVIYTEYTQENGMVIEGWYAYNEKGEVYGNQGASKPLMEEGKDLDLYIVIGNNDVVGFVRKSEEPGANLETYYDVLNYMTIQHLPRTVYVYECDGETIIGTYTIGSDKVSHDGSLNEPITDFRYAMVNATKEPFGTFEMAKSVEEDEMKLDLITNDLWVEDGEPYGLFRQSELGCDCYCLKEFEIWLSELKEPITVNVYDSLCGEVIGEMTFGD